MVTRARTAGLRERGYNLVALAVLVTILGVLTAAAMPIWSHTVKREKEAELIFRGLQYAEAIRVFQVRFGRFPVRLEELIELKPRCLRQLWEDPVTGKADWQPIFAQVPAGGGGQGGAGGRQPVQGLPPQTIGGDAFDDDEDDEEEEAGGLPRRGETVTVGPIIGVRSRSKEKAIRSFLGSQTHSEWQFTVNLLPVAPTAPGEVIPRLNSDTIGRPFPEGFEPEGIEGMTEDEAGRPTSPDRKKQRKERRKRQRSEG